MHLTYVVLGSRGLFFDDISGKTETQYRALWLSLKQEIVYLHELTDGLVAERVISKWITFYNSYRPHAALDKRTPDEAYFNSKELTNWYGKQAGYTLI